MYNGILRIDLDDPSNTLHMTHPSDPGNTLPDYRELVGDASWAMLCCFNTPAFDADGNLWVTQLSSPSYYSNPRNLWVWPAASRRNDDMSGWTGTYHSQIQIEKESNVFPLRSQKNRNYLIMNPGMSGRPFYLIDTKGTVTDFSDDEVIMSNNFTDQDGNLVPTTYIYNFFEDQQTGLVWVCHATGIFTFDPSQLKNDPNRVRRIKVARNDGTNLADYLLEELA